MILNKKENVSFSEETVEKVMQAAKELNYTTPSVAKPQSSLIKKLIALFTPTMINPYYPMLNQAIEETAIPLGYNVLVGFMPWRGYNFEDAIILSERLIKEDIYTSIHIEEYELQVRDTKRGSEEITREIHNVSEDSSHVIHISSELALRKICPLLEFGVLEYYPLGEYRTPERWLPFKPRVLKAYRTRENVSV